MRNEPLTAYVLHARPFQDKRAIYQLLTREHGVVHGIGKRGMPQCVPLSLFATGKNELKTLTQIQLADPSQPPPNLAGQSHYASFYVNEITLKCLPIESEAGSVFEHYAWAVHQMQTQPNTTELKVILRYFEQCLFGELGMAIDWRYDSLGQAIEPNLSYRYVLETGWQAVYDQSQSVTDVPANRQANIRTGNEHKDNNQRHKNNQNNQNNQNNAMLGVGDLILGSAIIGVQQLDWQAILTHFEHPKCDNVFAIEPALLHALSGVHRQLIDHIFDYKPLQSRILWRQWQQYQT